MWNALIVSTGAQLRSFAGLVTTVTNVPSAVTRSQSMKCEEITIQDIEGRAFTIPASALALSGTEFLRVLREAAGIADSDPEGVEFGTPGEDNTCTAEIDWIKFAARSDLS
jgi:hypothetical protein